MSPLTKKMMKNAVAWVEIPVKDLGRAKKFYQNIFGIEMEDMEMGDDFKMSMFPVEKDGVGGALCQWDEFYQPGHQGPLIYFSANPDLKMVLNKVEESGGTILGEKKKISDEYGYYAIFEDSEGNRVALHSMS